MDYLNLNSENEINIEDRLSVANNNFAESLTLIIEYPLVSLKEYGLSLLHYVLLKPNEIHYLIENTTLYDGQFYNSKKFNDEKVIKTIYSIIIYSISLIGLIYLIKKKENRIIFLLFFSILYFSLPVVWHKQSSYLAPSLIYISIFFGFGTKKVLEVLGFKKNE